jgi:hypothetical protein
MHTRILSLSWLRVWLLVDCASSATHSKIPADAVRDTTSTAQCRSGAAAAAAPGRVGAAAVPAAGEISCCRHDEMLLHSSWNSSEFNASTFRCFWLLFSIYAVRAAHELQQLLIAAALHQRKQRFYMIVPLLKISKVFCGTGEPAQEASLSRQVAAGNAGTCGHHGAT